MNSKTPAANNTRLIETGTRANQDKHICPECGHQFQGQGWTGIDAHWKSKHEHVMPYDTVWKLISKGEYRQSAAANNTRIIEVGTRANQDKVASVNPGDYVKAVWRSRIRRNRASMWVEVVQMNDEAFYGFVANEPVWPEVSGVQCGDPVAVLRKDVLDVR
jgi:hypothetical protein